ncbi:MAG TPA: hypothetical protein VE258_00765 [Ktedonobacterales bacterium]|nr:hypothetical protein [Ktedonobacterales bacterium]
MHELQDNRLPPATWFRMATLGLIAAVALGLVTRQGGFVLDSLPVIGLVVALGIIRSLSQVREAAEARRRHQMDD